MALEHMLQQLQLLSQAAVSTSSEQAKKPTPPSKQVSFFSRCSEFF